MVMVIIYPLHSEQYDCREIGIKIDRDLTDDSGNAERERESQIKTTEIPMIVQISPFFQ